MQLFNFDEPLDHLSELIGEDPALVLAFDGWTDAGAAGTRAGKILRESFPTTKLGVFPSDALYDYRDRRPSLAIRRGDLGRPSWPEVIVDVVNPPSGPALVLVSGPEPDLAWRALASDLTELAATLGAGRYVGLGSVPGPLPHTRPVQLVCTSSSDDLRERIGRPHEEVIVPASCQVAIEAELARAGIETLGLWTRIPHYVAGEYPAAARTLLEQLSSHLGTPVDLRPLDEEAQQHRAQLDLAAEASQDVLQHVQQLEALYDAEREAERELHSPLRAAPALREDQVPTADDLAAEIERFLQGRAE